MNLHLATGDFFGETLRQFDAGGFGLSETRYLPRTTLPRHSHESHYFGFVLRGFYRERFERTVRSCEPSTLLYHPAGELHSQQFDQTAVRLFRIEVRPQRLQYPARPNVSITGRDFRGGSHVQLTQKLYHEFRERDAVSHLVIEGLALELIASLARDTADPKKTLRQPPRWLNQAHDLVLSRYLESLTLGEIAAVVGVHPITLAREFQRAFGCTVGQMVRRERIKFACRKLQAADESIAEIATASGFYDQSHFARTFKKLMGLTPAIYRTYHQD